MKITNPHVPPSATDFFSKNISFSVMSDGRTFVRRKNYRVKYLSHNQAFVLFAFVRLSLIFHGLSDSLITQLYEEASAVDMNIYPYFIQKYFDKLRNNLLPVELISNLPDRSDLNLYDNLGINF